MYYLIHTTNHIRPFLTTHNFIAQDFCTWGCRVDVHPHESQYIAEIRRREKEKNRTEWRVELMEIWAREVVIRKKQERERRHQIQAIAPTSNVVQQTAPMAQEDSSQEERRTAVVGNLVQDFVDSIAAFDKFGTTHTPFPMDPRPLPASPLGLISKYMRLLRIIRYTSNAPLPTWSSPDVLIADQVTLEFRFHEALKKEHLVHAVNKTICKDMGRMGRVERDTNTGVTKVVLFVDVSDCVLPQGGGDEEMRDPVPVYERGEGPPPYVDG
ncbi:hypothetical protein BKA66DRAFT_437269 [Pyrenochaeta sp. MPI-SDFR-AT-0127]|nr:hypothetical protein BKA66DRAFT_437269 [Pyrenochaeta sp. MPI-SDFR-AT-0127]